MVTEVEKMHRRLATLDEFSYALPADDIHLAWSTMEYPRRVHDAAYDTETRIEMDKVRMMDKLAIEKNRFDELLDQFPSDWRSVLGLGEPVEGGTIPPTAAYRERGDQSVVLFVELYAAYCTEDRASSH